MRRTVNRWSTARRAVTVAVLLGVLAAGYFAFVALAAPPLAAPTITVKPSNPSTTTAASFTFTHSQSVTFQCALDTPTFTNCAGPGTSGSKAYTVGQGSHTFQVRAKTVTQTSSPTSYTWLVDSIAPVAPAITSGPSGLTASASASFAFTGEAGASFQCALDSTASPAACSSPKSYSGLPQGPHTFYVRQTDAAGNIGPWASRAWTVDTVPPPAPGITTRPDDPNGSAISIFEWTEAENGVTFQCSIENGAFQPCVSGVTYIVDVSNNGLHQFAVRAIDAAGNVSVAASWSWKVDPSVHFTITGTAGGLLHPGQWVPLALSIVNQKNFVIKITGLSVSVSTSPPGCPAGANVQVQPSPASSSNTFTVPANSTTAVPAAFEPMIRLKNTAQDQYLCKNQTFSLSYSGTATK